MAVVFILLLLIAISNSAVVNQTCIASGKFVSDYNCTSYSVCLNIEINGAFASYNVKCPAGFTVRQADMVCTKAGNVCLPDYNCTAIGNYTDALSVNGSSYISCIQGVGNMIIATKWDCPLNYTFDDTSKVCNHISDMPIKPLEVSTEITPLITGQMVPSASTPIVPISNVTQVTPTSNTTQKDAATPTPVIAPVTAPTISSKTNSAAHFNFDYCIIVSSFLTFYIYNNIM